MDYSDLLERNSSLFQNSDALLEIVYDHVTIEKWRQNQAELNRKNGNPAEWSNIGIILDDPYILVLRDLVKFPNSELRGYIRIVNRADLAGGRSVVIMAMLNNRILLLNQFRHSTRSWHFEFPRGFGEPGVAPIDQARAEIREEVAGEVIELVELGVMHSNTGLEAGSVQLYLAKLSSAGEPNKLEGIKALKWVTIDQLEDMIRDGVVTDGFTIAAYVRSKLKRLV